ncbi:MAG: hypothetical protein GOVbin564_29 [Prokaryotic dsDNA virus sp.]|nr:MAG: hypothetical protein GOVbin564_29 [Prokaryotic dsDNA virus sp.]|tara:strand:+ start:2207 stop:2626 length:420 start_codon:yes stop_codon:yes gene_type:complete
MILNLVLPAILQLGFATITLDDGHEIRSKFVPVGTVAPSNGFIVSVGDMADIQSALHGNSCLIRVSEIKTRFELEVKERVQRCESRINIFQKTLDETKQLNEHLKQELEQEKEYSNKLLIVSGALVGVLTASTLYLSLR